jgi:hypothetical protein
MLYRGLATNDSRSDGIPADSPSEAASAPDGDPGRPDHLGREGLRVVHLPVLRITGLVFLHPPVPARDYNQDVHHIVTIGVVVADVFRPWCRY